jgi:uncharacterized protein
MPLPGRPIPVPDHDDEFFWAQLPGRLMLPVCENCGHVWMRPTPACPQCGSGRIQPREHVGQGAVYSWVVVHRALDPAFADDVPYAVVTVELECGARLVGRLLGDLPPSAGMPVEFEPWDSGGAYLPAFRPRTDFAESG